MIAPDFGADRQIWSETDRNRSMRSVPPGYAVRNINYGMELLVHAFPDHFSSLVQALKSWSVSWADIEAAGGSKSPVSRNFDLAFKGEGWVETSLEIETRLAGVPTIARTHKIDLFKRGPGDDLPGIGIELEWNNKDEFFDRDLINFESIHRARGLAVGIVVTRGPKLQQELRDRGLEKFGARTTHWEKLMPRLDLGRGGATPIIAIGLEPDRIRP